MLFPSTRSERGHVRRLIEIPPQNLRFDVGSLLFDCSSLSPQFFYHFQVFRLTLRPLIADGGFVLRRRLRLLNEVERRQKTIPLDHPLLQVKLPGREI